MNIFARQGDLVIERKPMTGTPVKETDPVLAGGSSGHPHIVRGTVLVLRNVSHTGLRLLEPSVLEHGKSGGHKPVPLPAGDYEVRILRERWDESDREVSD
jgi:hypothetical protein